MRCTITLPLRSVGTAALVAAVVFALGYCFNLLVLHDPQWLVGDAFALGALIGLVVFAYEQRRARLVAKQIRIIRDMNRYIRNELQVIVSANPDNEMRADTIGQCVDNIDWALREILPGKVELATESQALETKFSRSA